MTGYAASAFELDGWSGSVSLRSVNHRFLDLHLHLPEPLLPLENKVRREIQQRNPRGHLELKARLDSKGETGVAIDEALLERYIEVFRRLGVHFGLPAVTDLATLCRLPGIVAAAGSAPPQEVSAELEAAFLRAVREALDRWDQMRAEEARLLVEDLAQRIHRLREWGEGLEPLRQEMVPRAQRKVQERLEAMLGQGGLDPARLAQEAALLADRSDVSEEILRLKAHAVQFIGLLEEENAGRKLDFLLQEMHREWNTLLSKTASLGEAGLPLTQRALEAKAEVEKLREQVQNLQ